MAVLLGEGQVTSRSEGCDPEQLRLKWMVWLGLCRAAEMLLAGFEKQQP